MANSWNGVRTTRPRCGSCGLDGLMTIEMTHEGAPVSVRYCPGCETHEWTRDGEPVGIDGLIPAMSRTKGDRRR